MVARHNHRASLGSMLLTWRVDCLFQRSEISEITIDTSQHVAEFFIRHGFRITARIANGFGAGLDQVAMSLQRTDWRPSTARA